MKILYIAPENVVGNLNLWQKIHRHRGHECRYITYFRSRFGYPEDICLNLPLVAPHPWFIRLRESVYRSCGGPDITVELPGYPPIWAPSNPLIAAFFRFRDWLWKFWVEPAIDQNGFLEFDVFHLETGLEFYRHGGFLKRLAADKLIVNTFHGIELRHRGVIPAVDPYIQMNFTSELDLLTRHPKMQYLFLPFDLEPFHPAGYVHSPITICHATRNRYFKGSDIIIDTCTKLEREYGIRFILIENRPHAETIQLKKQADIYIDQVTNVAPGYGMNSIEAMAMGQVCVANIDENYEHFLSDHPFVHADPNTLENVLISLIRTPEKLMKIGQAGRRWAEKHHSCDAVGESLYRYYRSMGLEC